MRARVLAGTGVAGSDPLPKRAQRGGSPASIRRDPVIRSLMKLSPNRNASPCKVGGRRTSAIFPGRPWRRRHDSSSAIPPCLYAEPKTIAPEPVLTFDLAQAAVSDRPLVLWKGLRYGRGWSFGGGRRSDCRAVSGPWVGRNPALARQAEMTTALEAVVNVRG